MAVNQDKLGLYKRIKLEKVKKELEEIQSNGEESILLIAERLLKELTNQGYKVSDDGDCVNSAYVTIHKFRGKLSVGGIKFDVEEEI